MDIFTAFKNVKPKKCKVLPYTSKVREDIKAGIKRYWYVSNVI